MFEKLRSSLHPPSLAALSLVSFFLGSCQSHVRRTIETPGEEPPASAPGAPGAPPSFLNPKYPLHRKRMPGPPPDSGERERAWLRDYIQREQAISARAEIIKILGADKEGPQPDGKSVIVCGEITSEKATRELLAKAVRELLNVLLSRFPAHQLRFNAKHVPVIIAGDEKTGVACVAADYRDGPAI